VKAMLLAAGQGERLLPLTRTLPKPLLPVLGRPLAPQILRNIARAGIDEAVINLHHLPVPLREALGDGRELGLRTLHYSLEPERLLGTGGGLEHAAHLLRGSGPILVRNSDFLSDIPLADVVASHEHSGCLATLVVIPHRKGYTPIEIDDRRRVVRFGGGSMLFTGYHVIEPEVLDLLPKGVPSDIVKDVYFGLAAERRLNAYVHDGHWWEFGTPREYLEGSLALIALPTETRVQIGDFDPVREIDGAAVAVGPGADLRARGLRLAGGVVLGFGARVEAGASIEDSVVMPEAWIGPGARLRRAVVGPGAEIPAGQLLEETVAAADLEPGRTLAPGLTRVDRLVTRRFAERSA
jgi:NDP-sugar pyrophosphorylase family protein